MTIYEQIVFKTEYAFEKFLPFFLRGFLLIPPQKSLYELLLDYENSISKPNSKAVKKKGLSSDHLAALAGLFYYVITLVFFIVSPILVFEFLGDDTFFYNHHW